MKEVITRFAPSPTGLLHAGNYRTALFSYIYARQNRGKFILRLEDTDKNRSKKEYEENIIESLKWLGLEYDDFYRQSERTEIYGKYIKKLIDEGKAFFSKEAVTEEGKNAEVIRFKNPNKKVKFTDMIRGDIEFDTTELGDFIIAKKIDEPVFHLVVVIDDAEVGITHIIRGEDHISNTPRHILLYEALGLPIPKYAHIPLLLAEDRSKLSKRKGALPITAYRDQGYIPEAIVNYLVLLGWHPEDEKEILSKEEMMARFTLDRVQKSGAIFDIKKLDWVNKEYLKRMNKELRIKNYELEMQKAGMENYKKEVLEKIEPLLTERINKFGDVKDLADRGELSFFFGRPLWKQEGFLWKGEGNLSDASHRLNESLKLISNVPETTFSKDSVKEIIWPYAEKEGRGSVLWPLRYALSGLEKSPDPFTIAEALGKTETVERLNSALEFLSK